MASGNWSVDYNQPRGPGTERQRGPIEFVPGPGLLRLPFRLPLAQAFEAGLRLSGTLEPSLDLAGELLDVRPGNVELEPLAE